VSSCISNFRCVSENAKKSEFVVTVVFMCSLRSPFVVCVIISFGERHTRFLLVMISSFLACSIFPIVSKFSLFPTSNLGVLHTIRVCFYCSFLAPRVCVCLFANEIVCLCVCRTQFCYLRNTVISTTDHSHSGFAPCCPLQETRGTFFLCFR